MCRPTTISVARPLELLFSMKSCAMDEHGQSPRLMSIWLTVSVLVGLLCALEKGLEYALEHYFLDGASANLAAILENETNRKILARHFGVDSVSCLFCAGLGLQSRALMAPIFNAIGLTKPADGTKPAPRLGAADVRVLTYHPAAYRLSLFFMAYQVKNLADTIAWNDGPEFIFHHVFSMITAWGALTPSLCHMYTIFYFGLSEVSTAVLCALANFDDTHGVPGLGDAFPIAKVALGGLFVTLFIGIRCVVWPLVSVHFIRDVRSTIANSKALTKSAPNSTLGVRNAWLRFYVFSLGGLSILQVAWLGQIFVMARQELQALGFLE